MWLRVNARNTTKLSEDDSEDEYLTRLLKLIPAESIALFTAATAILDTKEIEQDGIKAQVLLNPKSIFLVVIVGIIVSGFVRIQQTRDKDKNTQWFAVTIAVISFLLYVGAQKGTFGLPFLWNWTSNSDVPGLAVIFWVFLIPLFYKGDIVGD